jgi:hypothetical protein
VRKKFLYQSVDIDGGAGDQPIIIIDHIDFLNIEAIVFCFVSCIADPAQGAGRCGQSFDIIAADANMQGFVEFAPAILKIHLR